MSTFYNDLFRQILFISSTNNFLLKSSVSENFLSRYKLDD